MTDERLFWHRDLPPVGATPLPVELLEAHSTPVPFHWAGRETHWVEARPDYDRIVRERLLQELDRLGADFAHIVDEHIEEHVDATTQTFTLRGNVRYIPYRL